MNSSTESAAFHEGELAVQARCGAGEQSAAKSAKLIRSAMPDQHREFFYQLPFLLVGSVDKAGQPWASLLANPPGFIRSPDPGTLVIAALPSTTDPLYQALKLGVAIGLLGIEQHTRRRNRANGIVSAISECNFEVSVTQSFGNCAKYIQARRAEFWTHNTMPQVSHATALNEEARHIIERTDTFFIASSHPQANCSNMAAHGADVSHRGGKPGFVKINDCTNLTVPDFSGNRFFNTLGNLLLNPVAGLLFIDFETGDLLQLAVRAEIVFDSTELRGFAGAERLLKFHITGLRHTRLALPLRWSSDVQPSPFL